EARMNRLNDDRSLADRGGDPLHRARADIAHREHTGQVGLKYVERHGRVGTAILSGQDEATVVQAHRAFDPASAGIRTDHDEEPADKPFRHVAFAIANLEASQTLIARELDHL